jgi:hypothetical protein
LASADWRKKKQTEFPDWAAHPFEVGNGALLFHNGIFNEHQGLAEKYNLKDGAYTDTMAFLEVLKKHTEGGQNIDEETIQRALEEAGVCEYALLVVESDGTVWACRGERTLYVAETNYGILMNTEKNNLENAVARTNHVCHLLGWKPVEVTKDGIFQLKAWTIHQIKDAEYVNWWDTEERLKDINAPKPVRVVPAQAAAPLIKEGDVLDVGGAFARSELFLAIEDKLPVIMSTDDIARLVREVTGSAWWECSEADLGEVAEILDFLWTSHPEYAPSAEKDGLWGEVVEADFAGCPYLAATGHVKEFVFPYFHNTLEELKAVHLGLVG